jgi:hypothetical protein
MSTIRICEIVEPAEPGTSSNPARVGGGKLGVGGGLSNRDIGIIRGLTENTVKKYLMRMFERTGCDNRVVLAIRLSREPTGLIISSGNGAVDHRFNLGVLC